MFVSLFVLIIFFFQIRLYSVAQARLTLNSPCSLGWPQIHSNPPALVF